MTIGLSSAGAACQPEWLRRKERGAVWIIKLIVALALSLGRPAARLFLPPICVYFLFFAPASRRASAAYLTRALGRPAALSDVFRHYHTFASCALDRVFFTKNRLDLFNFRIFGEQVVAETMAEGGGCILLGAHLGSFEALRAVGRGHHQLSVNMVMYEENARKISSVLKAINPELAKEIISLGRPGAFLTIESCLERGNFVGVLADRSLTDSQRAGFSFLGAPAKFSTDPFRMIAILQKPVLLMFALYRGGNSYDIHIERFAAVGDIPRRPGADEMEQIVGRYVSRIEHHCRLAPYNWFNFYDVWQ